MGHGRLPNFLYIGVARAGSTWLYQILREHPQIFVPAAKDIYFFDRHYDKGLDWYRGFFDGAAGARAVGELSHDYYESPLVAGRIANAIPAVKLICCLRDPREYVLSNYQYSRTTHIGPDVSLAEFCARPETIHRVDYYGNLKAFFDRFPREQIRVLFYDDLRADPLAFAKSVYTFLEVDPEFVAPSTFQRVNPTRTARHEPLAQLVYRAAQAARRAGLANAVGWLKHNRLINRVLYAPGAHPEAMSPARLPDDLVRELRAGFADLEQLVDCTLPEAWYA